jgi:CRISPR-associated protein Cmr6
MTLPLPKRAAGLIDQAKTGYHPGLALDKHLDPPAKAEDQKSKLDRVCGGVRDDNLLASLNARRRRALSGAGAVCWTGTTQGPLTLHLSRATALENAGICLHPLYGFAYLPGSGLKGLARAWAERIWLEARPGFEREQAVRRIREIFGYAPHSEDRKDWIPEAIVKDPTSRVGAVVFHDAWPSLWPALFVDVAAVHHPKYYQADKAAVPPPGDWEDPNPNTFLAVNTGTEFEFSVAPRRPEYAELAGTAREWLAAALADWGAGAKTAAGYGRIGKFPARRIESTQRARFECTLELVTPAFLAGALQKQEDCDLRGATLRGQLRWWWRTMHAGHFEPRLLRRLETAIWGAASEGSAVQLSLYPVEPRGPGHFAGGGALEYLAYGMREAQRLVKPAGSKWRVVITARSAEFRRDPKSKLPDASITGDTVLREACAALWLLTRYGGVGAKGRKGFGSLVDVSIDGVSALDDCKRMAAALRAELQLSLAKGDRRVSWLERMREAEIPLTLNQSLADVAVAYREFVKSVNPKARRIALGYPRAESIGPPNFGADLGITRIQRYPTTVHFHLAKTASGLALRMAGFEIDPIVQTHDFFRQMENALRGPLGSPRSGDFPPDGRRRPAPSDGGLRPQAPAVPTSASFLFQRGDRVRNPAGDEGTVMSNVKVGETEMMVQIDGDLYPEKVSEWTKV